MDLRRITSKAKELVDKRGGTDALKRDADELKRIAQGEGSLTDKAKAAAAALKDPGDAAAEARAGTAAPADAARAAEKTAGEARGKHGNRQGRGRREGKRRGGGRRAGGGGRNPL